MKNFRENGDFKLVTIGKKRNYLVLEPDYHTTNFFSENSLPIEMKKKKKKKISMNRYL